MSDYTTAFILAPRRSGSTLLDNLLAGHPDVVSIGEIDKLRAYALEDRSLYDPKQPLICSCGATVSECPFWRRVEEAAGSDLAELHLQWPPPPPVRVKLPFFRRAQLYAGLHVLRAAPGAFRVRAMRRWLGGDEILADSWRLFDAVHATTGAACIVDDSKSPFRFRTLVGSVDRTVRAIVLCRDYRAVTHSLMRRGQTLNEAIGRWRESVTAIEEMLRDVPEQAVFRTTYESFCADPTGTLGAVHAFLGLTPHPPAESRSVAVLHHISGSPSKFDPGRSAIRFDDSYTTAFDDGQLAYLRNAAGPYALRWGYD
jgi:hypothetical protein